MLPYDPDRTPDVEDWLAADEQERIDAARRYHKRKKVRVPNLEAHALFHATVETQLAFKVPDVQDAFDRLRADGLDRHDAIHAIGWALSTVIVPVLRHETSAPQGSLNDEYVRALRNLTTEAWRRAT